MFLSVNILLLSIPFIGGKRGFAPGDRTKKSKFSSYSSPFLVLTFTFLSSPFTSITSLFTLTSKLNLALRLSGV